MAPGSSTSSSLLRSWLSAAVGVTSAVAGLSDRARAQAAEAPSAAASAASPMSTPTSRGPEAALSTGSPAAAVSDDEGKKREERLRAAEVEARAKVLSRSIRCLECASHQSIEDSHTDIAILMRRMIREDLRRGMQEKEILEKLRADYGDGVLYSPPLDFVGGAALWLLPVVCVAGFLGITWMQRRPPQGITTAPGAGFVRPRYRRRR